MQTSQHVHDRSVSHACAIAPALVATHAYSSYIRTVAVAVHGDNAQCDGGENLDLGKEHSMLPTRLHDIVVAPWPSPEASQGLAPPHGKSSVGIGTGTALTLRILKAGPSVLIRWRTYTAHTYAYCLLGFSPHDAVCSITPSVRNMRQTEEKVAPPQYPYMDMCHTQNIVPSSALQRELKKKKKEKERLEQMMKDAEEAARGEGVSAPGERGEAAA